MPELPEVETIVRLCRPRLEGRRVCGFTSGWSRNCAPSVRAVRGAIVGRTIQSVTRRAKFIVLRFDDDGYLLIHLRMSGGFQWAGEPGPKPSHVRAAWDLDDGSRLLFCDARKFGRITHTRDFAAATAGLGPEPLDRTFTAGVLARCLRRHRRQLKPLLLDQSVLAGLGNIYTDEALFRAGLHPQMRSDQLTPAQVRKLHEAIRHILRLAIRLHGTSLDWVYPEGWMQRRLMVYGRTGQPCRRCRTPIVALRIGQRGTHVCPRCQRKR